ncbi:MAG: hypothetical protein MUP85_11335 [Candidatus Lokiarchaeota archaeon]|nr:hypothetical protein [Candidatus Lokiarchaeota archaeon]
MLKVKGIVLLTFGLNGGGVKMYWSGFNKEVNLNMLKQIGFKKIWSKSIEK